MDKLVYLVSPEMASQVNVGDAIHVTQDNQQEDDFWVVDIRGARVYVERFNVLDQILCDFSQFILKVRHALHI